ncbi:C25 family cysteine peptidase [Porifericola rhodea]|uniref:putative type IX secretion system sortase PorU2 n=1 Tax=Porifericola rhodea TaxID=930972 RepID=UPI002666148C|nr:C25 family cysteine peptidase [Porifericola rhodea]WKN32728.1 C25 family cysteine peptidase [Porifericola rhodea]
MCTLLPKAQAQRFGNEWINYTQTYYKISVAEDGIYRVSYQDLLEAGFPVDNVDPRRIQLYFRGQEQAVHLEGQQDASFDTDDFLLFYGQKNDGSGDKELYVPEEAQTNPYHSLYSDSTAYFLTWSLAAVNGKRMSTFSENNIGGIPAEQFHWNEELMVLSNEFSMGRQYPIGSLSGVIAHLSTYDYGEGWTGPRIKQGESVDYSLATPDPYTAGDAPQLEMVLAGRNNQQHNVTIQVGSSVSTLRTLTTAEFSYYDHTLIFENLNWSDISGGQLIVRLTVNGVNGKADNVSLSYLKIRYPQQTSTQSETTKEFNLVAKASAKSYVELANAPANPYLLDITDEYNAIKIGYNLIGNRAAAIIPNTNVARKIILGSVKAIPSLQKANFQKVNPAANFLMISHALLRAPGGNYSDPVKSYQEYRASAAGGGYTTLLMDINDLYNQFNYGEVSPLAIRHFADYMLNKGNPEYLLIIGKGLTPNYNYHRKDPESTTLRDLVPTGGMPGSDVVLTSGLAGSDGYNSAIPTGRINAQTAAEVAAYLDKVKESEGRNLSQDYQASQSRDALWKKHLVHLSGGVNLAELTLFSRYVDELQTIAENDYLGGEVNVQSKQSNSATELINIADEVNKGLSLITFFGHSSTTRSDIEIGYVSNSELGYNNKGKYPAILINGCNAGNIFSNALTFGEDWIKTPDKGALHVIAHSSEGISSVLKRFSNAFYSTGFGDSTYVGGAMGKIKDEASRQFMELLNGNFWEVHIAQVRQAVLQGDPAVSLFGRQKPDFHIDENNVTVSSLQDATVTVSSDSFALDLVVKNFGRSTKDSMRVTINRTLKDGSLITYGPRIFKPVLYEDTLSFVIQSDDEDISPAAEAGDNRFEVIIDSGDSIPELNESNNRVSITYFMPLGGTAHLTPAAYGIASETRVNLQWQAGDYQSALKKNDQREFLLEVDTSYSFNSALKQQFTVSAKGIGAQIVDLPITLDSTVYFWRTKYAEIREGEIDEWTQSSFTYIADHPESWAQLSFDQLNENQVSNLEKEGSSWVFPDTELEVEVTTFGAAYNSSANEQIYVNGTPLILPDAGYTCRNNSINIIAFDRYSLNPYLPVDPGGFDLQNPNICGRRPQMINTYTNSQVVNGVLDNLIEAVNEGDPVILFNIGTINPSSWSVETIESLEQLGINPSSVTSLQEGEPFIFIGRKNAEANSATEILADPSSETLTTEQLITHTQILRSKLSQGSILSKRIGPAAQWGSLSYQIKSLEDSDIINISVLGDKGSGEEQVLLSSTTATATLDLSALDASQYDYLLLKLEVEDVINQTPAQLDYWLVTYEGLPEGVILSESDFSKQISKQEGESFSIPFEFYNLSAKDFSDSLQVVYSLFNHNSRQTFNDTLYVEPLASGDTVAFSIEVSTMENIGENDLKVNVNPRQQAEQSYNNNSISVTSFLKVEADALNPIIDVAFDGTYILDGDIVSPSPMITIEIRDENPYLVKQDTSGIDIYLGKKEAEEVVASTANARTTDTQMQRVSLNSKEVSWTPAEGEEPFKINFQPSQLEDGTYTLSVQAEDASGNASGAEPYEVNFEIINESTITNFYPYPNPFSTSTRFVFTLTGQDIPDQIKVQIMTVSGKVVREITQDELGPIRIGNNITDYAWDGRDEFGDELANGVYLYRVLVRSKGKALDLRETAGDRGFKNGFGKMYILR